MRREGAREEVRSFGVRRAEVERALFALRVRLDEEAAEAGYQLVNLRDLRVPERGHAWVERARRVEAPKAHRCVEVRGEEETDPCSRRFARGGVRR